MTTTLQRFYIKQGDTLPAIRAVLKDANDNLVVLDGYETVKFHMALNKKAAKIDALATVESMTYEGETVNGVAYYWSVANGDTDTAGEFNGEFQVTFDGGGIETFPNNSNIIITITKQLA